MKKDAVTIIENKMVPIYLRVVINIVSLSGPTVSTKNLQLIKSQLNYF